MKSLKLRAPATLGAFLGGIVMLPLHAAVAADNLDNPPAGLGTITVQGARLNRARATLSPKTGTTNYHFDIKAISTLPQGVNASLQDVLLHAPGVAQDSFGQLHVRGDHGDIQYRINGIVLPEGISGFGNTLGTRFIGGMNFLTGALPAQYGYRTAGVVNINTNTGAMLNGGSLDLYGGSHGTFQPSFEYGGIAGSLDYYATGTYHRSNIGIESPTAARNPIHDDTEQARGFVYLSDILNPGMRLTAMLGHSLGNFEIPNNPNQAPQFRLAGIDVYPSSQLDETQRELNDYGILALQGFSGTLNYQVAFFSRYSSVEYHPDPIGDLLYNGVAAHVFRRNIASGIQADASDTLSAAHTLRWGLFVDSERATSNNRSLVFPADADGIQTSDRPFPIVDNHNQTGGLYGAYIQDQWQPFDALTINYGARYDVSTGYVRESQLSPRFNFVYKFGTSTALHGGYSRYFTPPPLELVASTDIARFQGTTNALPSTGNTDVKAQSDDYYDIGITHSVTRKLEFGLDAYYKDIDNLLDEGQFGQALVFSPFNYAHGRTYGLELSTSYIGDNISAYFNAAWSRALGRQVASGQYNFDPIELQYIANHYVHLDHDQTWTASAGVAYTWLGTRLSLNGIFGSGLRRGFANTGSLPSYAQFNLGATHDFDIPGIGLISGRVTIINIFDRVYRLRDGSGIGAGAPQYGPRRGFFIGVTKSF